MSNWDFLMRGVLEVTSRELNIFQKGILGILEIKKFSSVGAFS